MTLDQYEAIFDVIRSISSRDSLIGAYRSLLTVYPVISFEIGRANTFSGEFVWQKPASRDSEIFFGLTKEEFELAQKRGHIGGDNDSI
jgi:hypothetical protein